MSLQQTVQEQLFTHMCEARLPHHIYKNLTMDKLPKANSSNYSTLKIKRACVIWCLFVRCDTTSKDNKRINKSHSIRIKKICPSEDMISKVKRQPMRLKISTRDISTIHIASFTTFKELDETRKRNGGACGKNRRRSILKWFRGLFVCLIDSPPLFWTEFLL